MRRPCVGAVGCAVLLAVVGCSNRESPINRPNPTGTTTASVVDGVQKVEIVTDDGYRFTPATVVVHPGRVELTLVHNGRQAPHDLAVPSIPGAQTPLVQAGQRRTLTLQLTSPGTYQFVCTIHVRQGQTGNLVVLPS